MPNAPGFQRGNSKNAWGERLDIAPVQADYPTGAPARQLGACSGRQRHPAAIPRAAGDDVSADDLRQQGIAQAAEFSRFSA